jgi:photosystem II stability/assembly factor-like uncharacterized protein
MGLALDPVNPDIIYLGGYEYDGSSQHGHIYKTTDGGANWTDITGIVQGKVYSLAIDPTNPRRVLAGTDSGIYRSTDAGLSWQPSSDPASAYDLVIDPANPNVLYAGANVRCYKSVNGGENWSATGAGLSGRCASLILASSTLLFGSNAGIYRSADGGLNWQESDSGIPGSVILGLAAAPSAPGLLYAAGYKGFYRSSDYGNGWSRLSTMSGSHIVVNPANADEILMKVTGGISRSTDGGHTWANIFNGAAFDFAVASSAFIRVLVLLGL